jgi:hypothetical protein
MENYLWLSLEHDLSKAIALSNVSLKMLHALPQTQLRE